MDYEHGRKRLEEERLWLQKKGNPIQIERQRKKGKFHVSERIEMLLDPGTWLEYGDFARSEKPGVDKDRIQRDGTMVGFGKINGRTVAVVGDDITVFGGTQSFVNMRKADRVIEIAIKHGFSIISLSEGGGGRVPDAIGSGFARLMTMDPIKSLNSLANWRKRPLLISAMFGYCYGDPALRGGFADITIMVEDSAVAISGPPLLKAAISEEITDLELGGPELHQVTTGLVDLVVKDEKECIKAIKNVLNILRPPETTSDPIDRLVPSMESIVPYENRKVYDIKKVINEICDNEEWLELKSRFGKGLFVGLARMGGQVIGIIANQPLSAGGAVDAKALKKSAAFMELAAPRWVS